MSKNQLMQCPNFAVCQTWVQASKRGLPHKYGVYNPVLDKIVYIDCPGG